MSKATQKQIHDAPSPTGYPGKPRLGHHFDSQEQQYSSGKLGIWLFLVTEVLLFGGLFCAYAVYRANHPEIFVFAHTFLDKTWGGVNTIVLLTSSLTMAWAVRAAQLGQRRALMVLLALTLVCACAFLGIKGIEYDQKWKHGLLWGRHFQYEKLRHAEGLDAVGTTTAPAGSTLATAESAAAAAGSTAVPKTAGSAAEGASAANAPAASGSTAEGASSPSAPVAAMRAAGPERAGGAAAAAHDEHPLHGDIPRNVHIFFGIYFVMTGLHGLHVIAGMVVITWLLLRARRGDFGRNYFAPVDFGGLYWHLVDIIWIFLFPLLYLIH